MTDPEEASWEDEQGVLVLSMKAKVATLISALLVLAAVSAPEAVSRIYLPSGLAALSLAVFACLLAGLGPVRGRVKELFAQASEQDQERGTGVNPGRLIFLLFGFLGLSNIARIPVAPFSEALWQWSANGILGLVQIWIGFTQFWKKEKEILIGRRTCYICLCAGLWAIVPPFLDHLENQVLLRGGGMLLDWSALLPVFSGFGRLPFFSGVAGWGLACLALYLLWRSRHEGPKVDLAGFLRGMAGPIGFCLLVFGVLISLLLLGAFTSDSSYGEKVWAFGIFGVWAFLSFSVALPLCDGRGPESFRWRMAGYLLLWIALLSYMLVALTWYHYWSLRPSLGRFTDISAVLNVVVFLCMFLSILCTVVVGFRSMKRRTLRLVGIVLGLLYVACWLVAIVPWPSVS